MAKEVDRNLGVVFEILTLQAEVHVTDALHELVKLLKPVINLRSSNDNELCGPDFDLDKIHKALARALGMNRKFPTLFEQLSEQASAQLLKVGHPELSLNMNINEIALSFEV